MMLGTIRPIALSHLSQAFRSLVIARRCHSALYGCCLHNFLPEVSPGSLARVQVLGRHSGCRAWGALRARGSPTSNSILPELNSSLMVQGVEWGRQRLPRGPRVRRVAFLAAERASDFRGAPAGRELGRAQLRGSLT